MHSKEKVLVFDTSAFIMGLDPSSFDLKIFTTPEVVKELSNSLIRLRISTALCSGKLRVESAPPEFLTAVSKASTETGDHLNLSNVDTGVLALALKLRFGGFYPVIVSDDFSVQNVAEHLDINYTFLSKKGIKTRIKWVVYCPACRRSFTAPGRMRTCPVCGAEVKRRALKKLPLKKTAV